MSSKTECKKAKLLKLARCRKETRLDGYACIGDFHNGVYECDHVSPITKTAGNVNADIIVVLQDWASADSLSATPPDCDSIKYGYTPSLPTNRNLDCLLDRYFELKRAECYLTNLFPFVKGGDMSARIKWRDLVTCAKKFTLPEIKIVDPKMVICLGLSTFLALRHAAGKPGHMKLPEAINTSFFVGNACVRCVPHTGARGTNNRGRDQIKRDWENLATIYKNRES